jgi:hypothetical protein
MSKMLTKKQWRDETKGTKRNLARNHASKLSAVQQ